jgi:hypothetical protein
MLSGVQGAKMAGLHIKEPAEDFSEIIRVPVSAGDGDFVDIH